MGNMFSSGLPDHRVFMTGVICAGKTTLLRSLGVEITDVIPMIGFNLPQVELQHEGKHILLYSTAIGGCDKLTPLFAKYGNTDSGARTTSDAAGDRTLLICVVDSETTSVGPDYLGMETSTSATKRRAALAYQRAELDKYFLRNGDAFAGCPILFIANKQDAEGASSLDDIVKWMGLRTWVLTGNGR
jgi:hypothetical protein